MTEAIIVALIGVMGSVIVAWISRKQWGTNKSHKNAELSVDSITRFASLLGAGSAITLLVVFLITSVQWIPQTREKNQVYLITVMFLQCQPSKKNVC